MTWRLQRDQIATLERRVTSLTYEIALIRDSLGIAGLLDTTTGEEEQDRG